jgi:hypothetical protein
MAWRPGQHGAAAREAAAAVVTRERSLPGTAAHGHRNAVIGIPEGVFLASHWLRMASAPTYEWMTFVP